jgi:hypothetical protein
LRCKFAENQNMTDSEILELRDAYKTSGIKMVQFDDNKGLDYEKKNTLCFTKSAQVKGAAYGEISFTAIKTTQRSLPLNIAAVKNIVIITSDGTTIQIPV